jgi:hypothetical protein
MCALVFFVVVPCDCTSIVAILNNETVVIAADSKEMTVAKTGEIYMPRSVCKIHQGNNFFWAVADTVKDPNTTFDIKATVGNVARTAALPSSKVDRLDRLIPQLIQHEAEALRRTQPKAFQQFADGQPFLEVLFIGFEQQKAIAVYREYLIKATRRRVEVVMAEPIDCPGAECRESQMFVLGERLAIDAYFRTHKGVFQPTPIEVSIDTIRNLVQSEINDSPLTVGPPIDIARIDRQGMRWINHKSQCPGGERIKQQTRSQPKPKTADDK